MPPRSGADDAHAGLLEPGQGLGGRRSSVTRVSIVATSAKRTGPRCANLVWSASTTSRSAAAITVRSVAASCSDAPERPVAASMP